ncbi:MAG: metallopeptidase TldD-related protein [Thermoanaerobaculia bacterium]
MPNTPKRTPPSGLLSLPEITSRLERTLERSPADETELVWLEVGRHEAANRGQRVEVHESRERTILVRVLDRGRVGSHRTGTYEVPELESAVRMAIAQSRSREPLSGLRHLPADETPIATSDPLYDAEIARLDAETAGELLRSARRRRAPLALEWTDARVAVFNSRGVRRQVAVTTATFEARCDGRPGGGWAAGASRTLEGLALERIVARARQRHVSGAVGELPTEAVPAVLSPEAVTALCDILNRVAFSAISYYEGSSFLRQHLNVQVFDRDFHLRDDGTDPRGLPFPFDLEGSAKRSVELILKGTPKTPALDHRQAALLGLAPTAHAIAGNDARALNLFMLPGEDDDQDLLQAADGGIWLGWIDHLECFEPTRVQIRAHVRGVRRIRHGRLAEPLPDLTWEDGLLRAFSSLLALGKKVVLRSSPDGYLGGFSAPAVAISDLGELRPL